MGYWGYCKGEEKPQMKEHQHIEWKASWRDEYLKWISGFANAGGGKLVLGKTDKGIVTGIPDAEKLLVDLPNKIRDVLGIMVDVNLRTSRKHDYLELSVSPYPNPISYRGEYYYRSGSTNQTLKGAALDRFLLNKRGMHWDGVPIPALSLNALQLSALKLFKKKAAKSGRIDDAVLADGDSSVLANLHLKEGSRFKVATVLLFGKQPEKYVPGAYIKIGYFVTDDDLRYQDEVHGDLFSQVEKTLELLKVKYLKAYISYEGVQRLETYLFPMQALREALLNAVIHKDYGTGIPIQISIYEHQIVIWNSGHLPEHWKLENLLGKHPSLPYNPLLAGAFFRAGYIESWGRGIEKIHRECLAHDMDAPLYDDSMSGLMVTFRANPAHLQAVGQSRTKAAGQLGQKTTQKILDLLGRHPHLNRRELAEALGNVTENGVKYHLKKLTGSGRIQRVGADKGGHWLVIQ